VTNKLLNSEAFAGANSSGGGACRTGASAIWLNQRTDCFFLPLYPLTKIWSNGTV
jgi:hypothetical protein